MTMSNGKSIIVDTSRCTGCRGCQVACKQWNGLPASPTTQTGTYQNPPDFNGCTYKVVRFADGRGADGKPYWYFTSDMCRHCVEPPCLAGSSVEGGMIHDEATGAVVYTAKSKDDDFETAQSVCPYNVPRKNEETGAMVKCTMCIDRISNGMVPACVQACPTGAMVFGDRDEILAEVQRRVNELKKTHPKAQAVDADSVRVIFIVTDDPDRYHTHLKA